MKKNGNHYITLELPKGIYLKKNFRMRVQVTNREFEDSNVKNYPKEYYNAQANKVYDKKNAEIYDPNQVKISYLTLNADVLNRRDYNEALMEMMAINNNALNNNGGVIQIDDIDKSIRIGVTADYSALTLMAADLSEIEGNKNSAVYYPVTYDDGTNKVTDGIYDYNKCHIFLKAASSIITYPDSMACCQVNTNLKGLDDKGSIVNLKDASGNTLTTPYYKVLYNYAGDDWGDYWVKRKYETNAAGNLILDSTNNGLIPVYTRDENGNPLTVENFKGFLSYWWRGDFKKFVNDTFTYGDGNSYSTIRENSENEITNIFKAIPHNCKNIEKVI